MKINWDEKDIEWEKEINIPYRYHAHLHHKPTGEKIEQASETSFADAKVNCLKELSWRLAHWDEYQASKIKDND